MTIKMTVLFLGITLSICNTTYSQQINNNWNYTPEFTAAPKSTTPLEKVFYGVMGTAIISYALSEFVFNKNENLNFYQARAGMNYDQGIRNVWHENFGVENRVAPWFGFALEGNFQQWNDRTSYIDKKDEFGMGVGLMSYYRWYILGKKKLCPYLECGTGLFLGFEKFPYSGTKFTFNHSAQIGLEYTLENKNKIRCGYGLFHQSNNYLIFPNPGYDAKGFSISYSWFWKNSKW